MSNVRQWSCTEEGDFYHITLTYDDFTFNHWIDKNALRKSLFPTQVIAFGLTTLNDQLCGKIFPLRGYGYGRRE